MYKRQNNANIEKNTIIPIVKKIQQTKENIDNQYSLKNNLFDPSKSSPPNEFMLKLYNRVSIYEQYSLTLQFSQKKEDNLLKK
jgi:hypothetical protein